MEIQLWREILNPYELAVKEVMTKFNHLIKEHRDRGLYCPIEQVDGRVKTISSILDKCQKKKIDLEDIEEKIYDLAGIRIICQFEEDIDTVASIIRSRSDMTIKSEKNYLKHIKQSGYRSYQRLSQLPHYPLLYGGYAERPQAPADGGADPHHGHEFLGHGGAFPPV